ncbi:MAG: acetyl-CoA carboxylase biotin carboxyl carrier protein [Chthoniobacter sp.]|nr:acetyl-CoA carboxylase biotin carboxyl carrier protein [Chthoniobacter sp.]
MKKNDLSVFKMEKEGFKIKLKKGGDFPSGPAYTSHVSAAPQPAPAVALPAAAAAPAASADAPTGKEITSPMVGTFYASGGPDAPPFVSVGQEVTPDTVICIIEAMKVMNEIKAETTGTISEVLAENGKPVQFAQPLFRLK